MKLLCLRKHSLRSLATAGLFDHTTFYKQFMYDMASCKKNEIDKTLDD